MMTMYSDRTYISISAKLTLYILLIAIFEGAVRKWLAPEVGAILISVRDFLAVIAIYTSVIENNEITTYPIFKLIVAWCFVVVLWSLVQALVNQTPILLVIIGIRFWLLYLVFAVFVGLSLSSKELNYITIWLFWVVILTTPLIIFQHLFPPDSFINKQVGSDVDDVFVLTKDIVRTTGTFSFSFGQTTFLGLLTPIVVSYTTSQFGYAKNSSLAFVALVSVIISTVLSGSRGAIIFFSMLIFIYMISEYILLRKKLTKFHALLIFILSVGGIASSVIFSRVIDATQERFETASESENISDRIIATFVGEPFVLDSMSWIGAGIGNGSNFAAVFLNGKNGFTLAETEPGRNLLEGGSIGVLFIAIKWILFIWCGFVSMLVSMRHRDSSYFLLCLATFIAALAWSVTGQITANVLGNFLVLFLVAKFSILKKESL